MFCEGLTYDILETLWHANWLIGLPEIHFGQESAAVSIIFSDLTTGFE
jgi:hypothetical protein